MIKIGYLFILLFLFGSSCISINKEGDNYLISEKTHSNQNVFTHQFLLDKDFNQLSLPNWFSSSAIRDNAILSIKLLDYEIDSSSKVVDQLKRERIIRFNEKGELDSLYINKYYQNKLIERVVLVYENEKDSFGYVFPKIVQQQSIIPFEDEAVNKSSNSKIISILKRVDNYTTPGTLLFKMSNLSNKDQYLYILEVSKQNIYFVDEWQEKNGVATIIYGSPNYPQKRFQVENLVNKSQQESFIYDNSGEFLTQIELNSNYSHQSTVVNYNKKGYISGLTEHHTDRSGQTIEYKKFLIKYNDKVLPEELILMQGVDTTKLHVSDKLIIKYSFKTK